MRDEAFFGQRTTIDVLNAQRDLLEARVHLVTAQRDHTVATYSILSATGQLSAALVIPDAPLYQPQKHFDQVNGKWFGLETPADDH